MLQSVPNMQRMHFRLEIFAWRKVDKITSCSELAVFFPTNMLALESIVSLRGNSVNSKHQIQSCRSDSARPEILDARKALVTQPDMERSIGTRLE